MFELVAERREPARIFDARTTFEAELPKMKNSFASAARISGLSSNPLP